MAYQVEYFRGILKTYVPSCSSSKALAGVHEIYHLQMSETVQFESHNTKFRV
jgi:hypothetical protein